MFPPFDILNLKGKTAAQILSASDKSARTLKRRLTEKGISPEAAEDALYSTWLPKKQTEH